MNLVIHTNAGRAFCFKDGAQAERVPGLDRPPVRDKIYQLPAQPPVALERGTYLSSLTVYMDENVVQSRGKPREILYLTRLSDKEEHSVVCVDLEKLEIDWDIPCLKSLAKVSLSIRTGGGKLKFYMKRDGQPLSLCPKKDAMKILKEFSHPMCFTDHYPGLFFNYPPNFDVLMKEIQQYPGLLSVQNDEAPLAQVLAPAKGNPLFGFDLSRTRPYRESLCLDEPDFARILETAKDAVTLKYPERDRLCRQIILDILKCHDPKVFPMSAEEAAKLFEDSAYKLFLNVFKGAYENDISASVLMKYLFDRAKPVVSTVTLDYLDDFLDRACFLGKTVSALPDDLKAAWDKLEKEYEDKTNTGTVILFG